MLNAYGVGDVPLGDLDLTPGLIEEHAQRGAMPHWPSLEENGIDGPTVRLSLRRAAGRRAEHGRRTYQTYFHHSFNWENAAPGSRIELPPVSWTREMGGFLCVST